MVKKCNVSGGRRINGKLYCGYCNTEYPDEKALQKHINNCEAQRDF